MSIFCLGLTHQTAALAVRERFAFPEFALPDALAQLKAVPGIAEGVIISTCNRTEFYVVGELADNSAPAFFKNFFRDFRAGDETYLFRLVGSECVRHLFRVASGLESMVVGETEIFGQIKRSYRNATAAGTVGRFLNRLFQKSFHVGKQVRSSTAITRGRVSVGSVAVDLAEQIFGDLDGRKIMLIGAGKTSETTAKAFRSRGAKQIFVSNRSFDKAVALAETMGGKAIRFDDWEQEFWDVDILVSSTAAAHAVVTRAKIEPILRMRRDRPLFIIDLAIPRDVEPTVRQLDDVYVYDLDSLRMIADRTLEARRIEMDTCERLIEQHVCDFVGCLGPVSPERNCSECRCTRVHSKVLAASHRSRSGRSSSLIFLPIQNLQKSRTSLACKSQ